MTCAVLQFLIFQNNYFKMIMFQLFIFLLFCLVMNMFLYVIYRFLSILLNDIFFLRDG